MAANDFTTLFDPLTELATELEEIKSALDSGHQLMFDVLAGFRLDDQEAIKRSIGKLHYLMNAHENDLAKLPDLVACAYAIAAQEKAAA